MDKVCLGGKSSISCCVPFEEGTMAFGNFQRASVECLWYLDDDAQTGTNPPIHWRHWRMPPVWLGGFDDRSWGLKRRWAEAKHPPFRILC